MNTKNILITGCAGYIASHTIVEFLNLNNNISNEESIYQIIGVDNFSNSNIESLNRVEKITGKKIKFYQQDVCDASLETIFKNHNIDAVIHFAAHKAVGESNLYPLKYYENNLNGLINVLKLCQKYQVNRFIFSSSATVYGNPKQVPIFENAKRSATNPYGQTKLMAEYILEDICKANPEFLVACLRYFNPVGAHPSGLIGESPKGIPSNLMPYITQVATGQRPHLDIFGQDYPTVDGTGVRDFIHVCDLAAGHVAACNYLFETKKPITVNLGSGRGYSVLELLKTFETVNGIAIPYQFKPRRAGDVAICYADAGLAKTALAWSTKHSIEEICRDAWNWQSKNPNGYF